MPERKPNAPPVWPDAATILELREYAMLNFASAISVFTEADQFRSGKRMGIAVRHVRQIATRMDQFRRVRVRRWTAEDSGQTHTHKGTT